MKKSLLLLVLLSGAFVTAAAWAVTDAEMQACFKAHAQLMQKPAVRNLVDCWREHGYLMLRK